MTASLIILGVIVAWWWIARVLRGQELHELSRERKLMLLSLHEARPKPFRKVILDKLKDGGSSD